MFYFFVIHYILPFYISTWCVLMLVNFLALVDFPFPQESLAPSRRCASFLSCISCTHVREGCATFTVVYNMLYVVWIVPFLLEHELWLDGNYFVCLTSNSLTTLYMAKLSNNVKIFSQLYTISMLYLHI